MSLKKKLLDQQSLLVDNFMYFFLRIRKPRIRAVVDRMRALHPDESNEQIANRLIESQASLSFLAGALFDAPALIPGVGKFMKFLGVVGGAAALVRMHLYLVLEIAHLYGKDIDDPERVPEMVAVMMATAASAAAPPLLLRVLNLHPVVTIPLAGLSTSALARLIGNIAIQHYSEATLPVTDG
jgi:hypothetical protein